MKRLLSVSVVTAVAAAGLLAAPPASAAAVPGVPSTCSAYARGIDSAGRQTSFGYANGKATWTTFSGDTWGFQPVAMASSGGAGDDTSAFGNDFGVKSDGTVVDRFRRTQKQPDGSWKVVESTQKTVATGWTNTRAIALSGAYVYRLTHAGLYRYSYRYDGTSDHPTLGARQTVRATGFENYRTLATARATSTRAVFRATTTSGHLREIVVTIAKPSTIELRSIRTSGFANVTALGFGYCSNRSQARTILTLTSGGAVRIHYEPTFDASGSDIVAGGNAYTGVTRRMFGQ